MTVPPFAEGVMWLALVLAITAGFVWFAHRLRNRSAGDELGASDMLAGFRQAYEEGELSGAEFQSIKENLRPRLMAEVAESGPEASSSAAARASAAAALAGWEAREEGSGSAGAPGEPEAGDAAEGAGGAGCDAAPLDGGDSTGESR